MKITTEQLADIASKLGASEEIFERCFGPAYVELLTATCACITRLVRKEHPDIADAFLQDYLELVESATSKNREVWDLAGYISSVDWQANVISCARHNLFQSAVSISNRIKHAIPGTMSADEKRYLDNALIAFMRVLYKRLEVYDFSQY
jgi:hypothetical protein